MAEKLFGAKALWNTMVLVGRASAIFGLYETSAPHLVELFTEYLRLPPARRPAFLAERYGRLPASDFSRDVLTPARDVWVYEWPASMGWSDLGTPERLSRWLGDQSMRFRMRNPAG